MNKRFLDIYEFGVPRLLNLMHGFIEYNRKYEQFPFMGFHYGNTLYEILKWNELLIYPEEVSEKLLKCLRCIPLDSKEEKEIFAICTPTKYYPRSFNVAGFDVVVDTFILIKPELSAYLFTRYIKFHEITIEQLENISVMLKL